jgi:hypothetical protein
MNLTTAHDAPGGPCIHPYFQRRGSIRHQELCSQRIMKTHLSCVPKCHTTCSRDAPLEVARRRKFFFHLFRASTLRNSSDTSTVARP